MWDMRPRLILREASASWPVQSRTAETALQGPRAGQRLAGPLAAQFESDQSGAPGGVLAFQRTARLDPRMSTGGGRGPTAVVVRRKAGLPAITIAPPELADRGPGEVQILGDGG